MNKGFSCVATGDGWAGEIWVSTEGLYTHIYAKIEAKTEEIAQGAVDHIYELFGTNRERFVRAAPSAFTNKGFDPKKTTAGGYVRFSFLYDEGEEHLPDPSHFGALGLTNIGEEASTDGQ